MTDPSPSDDLDRLIASVRWEDPCGDERVQMRLERRQGYFFLVVMGKVLQPVPEEFAARLRRLLALQPEARMIIDLTRCDYLASSTLGFLVDLQGMTTAARTVMLGPNDRVRAIVALLGLDQFLACVDTEQEAYAHFSPQ